MDELFGSLSEEWVSQHRSSSSVSIGQSPSATANSSQGSIESQSRIPRYKSRSTSNPDVNSNSLSRRKSIPKINQKEGRPLYEKTASDLNTYCQRAANDSSKTNDRAPRSGKTSLGRCHISMNSLPSEQQGTVQCKLPHASQAGERLRQATPDWKRRVLDRKVRSGEQLDLFGPIGLENVFKPPVDSVYSPVKKSQKYESLAVDQFPSSPPPYPSSTQKIADKLLRAARDWDTTCVGQLRISGEHDVIRVNDEPKKQVDSILGKELVQNSKNTIPSDHTLSYGNGNTSVEFNGEGSDSFNSRTYKEYQLPRMADSIEVIANEPISSITQRSNVKSRTASAQADLCHEKISPIIISRHNNLDSPTDYAALDRVITNHDEISQQPLYYQDRPSSRASDQGIKYRLKTSHGRSEEDADQIIELTSYSLPHGSSIGTEALVTESEFISLGRGGCSMDSSFLKRPLSPSSSRRSDMVLPMFPTPPPKSRPTSQEQLSDISPATKPANSRKEEILAVPRTPNKRPEESSSTSERPRSSGSPLKLFDRYDTFTNDRLARRMSQFEGSSHHNKSQATTKDLGAIQKQCEEDASTNHSEKHPEVVRRSPRRRNAKHDSFGRGTLDLCCFTHRFSSRSSASLIEVSDDDQENISPLPDLRLVGKTRCQFPSTCFELGGNVSEEKVALSNMANSYKATQSQEDEQGEFGRSFRKTQGTTYQLEEHPYTAEGKRLLRSPTRDPSPKRRRTTYTVEALNDVLDSYANHQSRSAAVQPIVGKKRKDACYEKDTQAVDPRILATRQILRPRTPTPSQARSSKLPRAAASDTTSIILDRTKSNYENTFDDPTHALAGQLATFALAISHDTTNGDRKASVTTADFLQDAEQVMRHIRAQRRPQSARTSVEESEAEPLQRIEESTNEESTVEEFSRPPSREGGSLRRLREPKQLDPRVISHLRKFEEKDDGGIALSASLGTLQITSEDHSNIPVDQMDAADPHGYIESDPPNVRIHELRYQMHRGQQSRSSLKDLPPLVADADSGSHSSGSSSGPPTDRTIPSSSSTASGNKAVIAPEKVRHLISDQVGGMTLDRTRQVWVKKKCSDPPSTHDHEKTASELTDEDPFQEIPDLSVDEVEELKRIEKAAFLVRNPTSARVCAQDHAAQDRKCADSPPGHEKTIEGQVVVQAEIVKKTRSPISKSSMLASNELRTDIRATSWDDDAADIKNLQDQMKTPSEIPAQENDDYEEEAEHEISILEGRVPQRPAGPNRRDLQARVVTVAFSSPLVDQLHEPMVNYSIWEDEDDLDLSESPLPQYSKETFSASRQNSGGYMPRLSHRRSRRRVSVGSQSYIARPISRIDEGEEVSFLQYNNIGRTTSVEVTLSTPQPLRDLPCSLSMPPAQRGERSNVTFHMSPLPDFSVHQTDSPLAQDIGHVAEHRGLLSVREVEGTLTLTTQELVRKITDVEPYEPYWEYIRKLELHGKDLITLHTLNDFCSRVEELDVSNNELGQLNGIPSCLRYLNVQDNCLTDMTAWGHLFNLQYLDVSGNQLQDLGGFQSLVHLRELRADNNLITSIDGIFRLDGLLRLSLKGNRVASMDFEGSDLYVVSLIETGFY